MCDKNETNLGRHPVLTGFVCNALGDLFAVAMMIAVAIAAAYEVEWDIGRIEAKMTPQKSIHSRNDAIRNRIWSIPPGGKNCATFEQLMATF
jgi:hypothetical protein